MSGPRKRRKQRQDRWLEKQVEEALEGLTEASEEVSGGSFFVLDRDTWEKTPGLSLQEAKELWRSLPNAMYFSMRHYSKKPAPGRALFDAGNIP